MSIDLKKLYQVYCAWLIKWWIISGTWWYWVSIWRYWLVLSQNKLVLLDIRWYMVSKGLVCLYILEKVEIWSGDTDAWHTDRQQNIGLLSFSTVSSLSWVTQKSSWQKDGYSPNWSPWPLSHPSSLPPFPPQRERADDIKHTKHSYQSSKHTHHQVPPIKA